MKEKRFWVSWEACLADGTAHAKAGGRGHMWSICKSKGTEQDSGII